MLIQNPHYSPYVHFKSPLVYMVGVCLVDDKYQLIEEVKYYEDLNVDGDQHK